MHEQRRPGKTIRVPLQHPARAHASSTRVRESFSAGEVSAFLPRAVSARSTTMPASRLGDLTSASEEFVAEPCSLSLEKANPRAPREVQRYPALSHLVSTI